MPEENTSQNRKDFDLRDDFPPTDYQTWREAAEQLLKGAPFEKTLFTDSYEGILLKPIYSAEDTEMLVFPDSKPGLAPFVRGSRVSGFTHRSWHVVEKISASAPDEFNRRLKRDLRNGLTAAKLTLDRPARRGQDLPSEGRPEGLAIRSIDDFERALDGVDLSAFPIFIDARLSGVVFAAYLAAFCKKQSIGLQQVRGCIESDPLGELALSGTLLSPLTNYYADMRLLTTWAAQAAPLLQTIAVDSTLYHDAGASAVEELACALATGTEYIRAATDGKESLDIEDVAPRIRFSFALGTHFFMEIAKLRAARLLWNQIMTAFGGSETAGKMTLHAHTSWRSTTVYDPHVNMLRATTQAFAGVLGGCDSLCVEPFDSAFAQPDDFARRIARNVQIILRHEVHLDRVADPAGGAWYVETLTRQLAETAWKLFQKIEAQGGMYSALKNGFIQKTIAKTAARRFGNLATRKDKLIGVNAYPNPNETRPLTAAASHPGQPKTARNARQVQTALANLRQADRQNPVDFMNACVQAAEANATPAEILAATQTQMAQEVRVTPLSVRRDAAPFEQLRFAVESFLPAKPESRPEVFLANMGPVTQHKARADFSTEFFQIAGLRVHSPSGFTSATDAAGAALASGAGIIVICASDETYPEIVPALTSTIKAKQPETLVVVAGYPKENVAAFKKAGVDEFIHPRSNVYETLSGFLTKLGILDAA